MNGVYPRTLQLYDIATLQYLYGQNNNYNSDDTSYEWKLNETFIETIWDGGGNDTIDASNQTRRIIINLNDGSFSSIGSYKRFEDAQDNLAIAYETIIENAFGGVGNDRIIGNQQDNNLIGNLGSDNIKGGSGNDILSANVNPYKLYLSNSFETRIREVYDWSIKAGYIGAFPNFNTGNYKDYRGRVWGTILLNSKVAEWKDIPASELKLDPSSTIEQRFQSVYNWARKHGYEGAFPNFHQFDYGDGRGIVYGTILLKSKYAKWQDIPGSKLGISPSSTKEERFRAVDKWAQDHGYIGAIPNFHQFDYDDGRGMQYGTILLKPGGAQWDDLSQLDLGLRVDDNSSNFLDGEAGNDTLIGSNKDDTLVGGGGDDKLIGGFSKDILTSSSATDEDTFIWNSISENPDRILRIFSGPGNQDRITDYDVSGSSRDKIIVRNSGFNPTEGISDLPYGKLPNNRFVLGTTSLDNRAGFRYFAGSGNLYFDRNGGSFNNTLGQDELLVTLNNKPSGVSMEAVDGNIIVI